MWILTILPAIALFQAGAGKLIHPTAWARHFIRWGYPGWFWLAIGILEVVAALALLVPRAASVAAIVLAVTMVSAVATFLHAGEAPRMLGPLLVLPFLCAVAYMRRAGIPPILAAMGWNRQSTR